MSHVESIRVKYHECDMQRVVFNANYWAYLDDAVAQWLRSALGPSAPESGEAPFGEAFDFMLKKAEGTWHKGAVYGDVIDAHCRVTRWGNSSFDVSVSMTVRGQMCFDAVVTYVSVVPGEHVPCPVPSSVRAALDGSQREVS